MKNTKQITSKTVSIILPTYNESASIAKIIREIKLLNKLFPIEIIVIDAHSTDNTVALAKKENANVIERDKRYGKGADFWYASLQAKGSYVVQIDSDLQFSPQDIPLMVQSLENGADVALGWRTSHKNAPFIRTLGNRIFVIITSIVVGKKIHDVVAGFKAFKKPVLLSLKLQEAHFGYEGEIVVKAVRRGYTIAQIPVRYAPRLTGKSQVNPLRDGALTIWSIFKARVAKLPKE